MKSARCWGLIVSKQLKHLGAVNIIVFFFFGTAYIALQNNAHICELQQCPSLIIVFVKQLQCLERRKKPYNTLTIQAITRIS